MRRLGSFAACVALSALMIGALTSVAAASASREIKITGKYLLVPVTNTNGNHKTRVTITVGDTLVHNLDVNLPLKKDQITWWTYLDMSEYVGKTAKVVASGLDADTPTFAMIESSAKKRHLKPLYNEKLRPQFHMSQQKGWNNDPNGMVYHDGEYHFFWQCNPGGIQWANMYWGHATSPDMVNWTEQPRALRSYGGDEKNRHPSMAKRNCFSGSANVDVNNTAGWQKGDDKPIVAVFTDTGCGEAIAYSTDRGKTWTYYEGNPVIKHSGRDPNLVWYEPGKHWVIAVYDHDKDIKNNISFYSSNDLKTWTLTSKLPGYFECPELFELPVDGNKDNKRWVVFAADARYAVGKFDGKTFVPEHKDKYQLHWGNYYASQCFSNSPDGRVVQVGWARIGMGNEMPFNQAFSLPTNLTLRTTPEGIRMFANPIKEIETLRDGEAKSVKAKKAPVSVDVDGQLFDILVTLKQGNAKTAALTFGKNTVTYDFAARQLNKMPLKMKDGKVSFRVLVDRPMFEVVGGEGACYQTARRQDGGEPIKTISIAAPEGSVEVESLDVYKMKSIWKK